ncbi:hypothetical protein [Hydrogenophaga crassostreae]|uniref:hypothetical protein n=1 Tax=Hydrogenophaga crassostreae TaxID=1763535 RepID=UPI0012F95110|nr:hypothetical protein [Hydrogenophaga crassostreae]
MKTHTSGLQELAAHQMHGIQRAQASGQPPLCRIESAPDPLLHPVGEVTMAPALRRAVYLILHAASR